MDQIKWRSDRVTTRSGFSVCLASPCNHTDGRTGNDVSICRCGNQACSASSTGLLCTSATSTCRPAHKCVHTTGALENTDGVCKCGAVHCWSGTGFFCDESQDRCSSTAACTAGTFTLSLADGTVSCPVCPTGRVAPRPDMAACDACPVNTYNGFGSAGTDRDKHDKDDDCAASGSCISCWR